MLKHRNADDCCLDEGVKLLTVKNIEAEHLIEGGVRFEFMIAGVGIVRREFEWMPVGAQASQRYFVEPDRHREAPLQDKR